MKWTKGGTDTIYSDAGYAILRTNGRYITFCKRPGVPLKELVLGGYDSPEDAKAAAEAHCARQDVTA